MPECRQSGRVSIGALNGLQHSLRRRVLNEPTAISNTVLLVETAGRRFLLKQSLGKLSVKADWFSDRQRIFRESAALSWAAQYLPPGSVPEILFEDPGVPRIS